MIKKNYKILTPFGLKKVSSMIFLVFLSLYSFTTHTMEYQPSVLQTKSPPSLKALTIKYVIDKNIEYKISRLPQDLELLVKSYKSPSICLEKSLKIAQELGEKAKINACKQIIAQKKDKNLEDKFENSYQTPKDYKDYLKAYQKFLGL
jgi:hypothetical protein